MSMEAIVETITAELPRAVWADGAASAFTQTSAWIWTTVAEMRSRQGELAMTWTDFAGTEHTAKITEAASTLTGWAQRLDDAQVPLALTQMANAVRATHASVVSVIYPRYVAALLIPFGAGAGLAAECVAEATAALAALSMTQTQTMGQVAASVGQSALDLVPTSSTKSQETSTTEGNSTQDYIAAVGAGIDLASEGINAAEAVYSLAATSGSASSGLDPSAAPGGLSLAGVSPVHSGTGWAGSFMGTGLSTVANPVVGQWAPTLALATRPAVMSPGAAMVTGGGMLPPIMPSLLGQAAAGAQRQAADLGESCTVRSGGGRRPTSSADGVPAQLRGRAAAPEVPHSSR